MSDSPKATNIVWHHGKLTDEQRHERLGQLGAVVWFTGLSASGKSTIAREVELALVENGVHSSVLDGDNIRHGLNRDLGFSPADRTENIRRIGEVAKLLAEANVITLTAFISPYRADRDSAREKVPAGRFFEVYVNAPIEVCEKRDPKGLYQKAREGKIPEFTGISAPYEEPTAPELVLHTGEETLEESTRRVLAMLADAGILPAHLKV
jgi:adenylylsulfate kinase